MQFLPCVGKQVATVQFSFDVDYHAVIRDAESKKMFLKSVEDELAEEMQVDKSLILNITVAPGSIVVSFILLAEKQSKFTVYLNHLHHIAVLREPPSILIKYKRTVTPNNILIVLLNLRFD